MSKPNIPFVDLKSQYLALKENIDAAIHKVLDHGMYINGPEVKESERLLAEFSGTKYAVACSSGTDALVMALMAEDIGPGDEVITTPFTFIATVEAIVLLGATPVLVDIHPDTYNINESLIENAITKKTKAIMPVSLYGQIANMDEINAIAQKNNLVVIEDAAQSFGATYNGKRSCSLSDYGCTSFFPAKPLGCYGDGGAIFTNDENRYNTLLQIRDHGSESRYYHTRIGINGRLDSIQCAIIIEKLKRYQWELDRRNEIAREFNNAFQELKSSEISTPIVDENKISAWAQYTLSTPYRQELQAQLKEKGIPSAVHYPGTVAAQPAYKDKVKFTSLPVAEEAAQRVLSLPISPEFSDEQVKDIISRMIN